MVLNEEPPEEKDRFNVFCLMYLYYKVFIHYNATCGKVLKDKDRKFTTFSLLIIFDKDKLPYSRGQDVIPWDSLAEIDFFVLSYSLTLSLLKKIGCHFFPPKLGYFSGPFKKFHRKQGKTGIGYHKNNRNICSTSFLIVLGSGNPNFGGRIL